MANKVLLTPYFEQNLKRLLKKYPSLANTLAEAEKELLENPRLGKSYGKNIYKLRVAGEGRGKSGGYRIITYVLDVTEKSTEIHLITIFTKSEESTINKTDAVALVKNIFG